MKKFNSELSKAKPSKRIDIVKIKLVKESSILYKERSVRSPEDGDNLLRLFLEEQDYEHFVMVCLNTKNQPPLIHTGHIGSLNASIVHPRKVMKSAIFNAASILVGHNHPNGNPEQGKEDIEVKKRIVEAGEIMEIEMLDHSIVDEGVFVSLKEKGYM
ncbi:JAB domain-containing protein [Bacillus cereus]